MDSASGKESADDLSGASGSSYQQKDRIEFINSLFNDTWCIFEKLNTCRIFYLFFFNVVSSISDVFFEDKNAKELEDMAKCVENQKKIVQISKEIFKRHNNN